MKVFCDDERYRQHIAELASSVFHLNRTKPNDDAEQEDIADYMNRVGVLEERVSARAAMLSQQFHVPLQLVHNDISECVDFLPDDLIDAHEERSKKRLH